MLPPWQVARGALSDSYDIPTVTLRRRWVLPVVILAILLSAAGVARHILFVAQIHQYQGLLLAWTFAFAFSAFQWILSYRDRPWTTTVRQQHRLDALNVVANIPLYNEDPEVVDRTLYALVNQTRAAQRIDVVDDGSTIGYLDLQQHWERTWPNGTTVRWIRIRNGGKKHAQAVTFSTSAEADIIVTVDSDTALVCNAIEEGLKPFVSRKNQSVAGIELAFNSRVNWLTRTVSARSLFFQIVACGAQSACGDILVNRGAYALYRAQLLRDTIPAYLEETFFDLGPIKLGDDAALTLFARGRGRAVQQSTAFALTMYPEKLSHHFRQWVRWMRGSTIRNCWRVRYLPPRSYGWWFTVLGVQFFLASTMLPIMVLVTWPRSATFTEGGLTAMLAWAYITGFRIMAVRRSDETWLFRLGTLFAYAPAMMWGALILRPLRFVGIATYRRQGWTTRTEGAELGITTVASDRAAA
jgi:hyaluronan synthase